MAIQYIITTIIFLAIDAIWLGILSRSFYDQHLDAFERTINLFSAALVYLIIPLGIVLFVLPKSKQPKKALLWGGIYGLIVYGVYDLTNLATLKDWSPTMVVVDMLWGMFICAITSLLATYILNRNQKPKV